MRTVSLTALQDREHRLHNFGHETVDSIAPVDYYMESNYGRLGEDSEELAMREKRARKVLSERPLPDYHPFE